MAVIGIQHPFLVTPDSAVTDTKLLRYTPVRQTAYIRLKNFTPSPCKTHIVILSPIFFRADAKQFGCLVDIELFSGIEKMIVHSFRRDKKTLRNFFWSGGPSAKA